jgi:hypothetical protein
LFDKVEGFLKSSDSHLIEFTFHGIHTFTIEAHPEGHYLVQGYQAAYSAFWWLGIADHPVALPDQLEGERPLPDGWETHKEGMLKMRAAWGRNKMLSSEEVLDLVAKICGMYALSEDGKWTTSAYKAFLDLPFYPGQESTQFIAQVADHSVKDVLAKVPEPKSAILVMSVHRIIDVETTRTELGGTPKSGSICYLILANVAQELIKLRTLVTK